MCHPWNITNLLLLHQFRIRAIVDNIRSKNRRSQNSIHLFGVDILNLPIENKLTPLSPQVNRRLLPQQNKSKAIAILTPPPKLALSFLHQPGVHLQN
jgi:hypothetical protein